jgi:hypothetical protein
VGRGLINRTWGVPEKLCTRGGVAERSKIEQTKKRSDYAFVMICYFLEPEISGEGARL